MMVHIRQPYFSILSATIFTLLGLAYTLSAHVETQAALGNIPALGAPQMVLMGGTVGPSIGFVIAGVCFLMAYFSIVHLKYKG
jgi:hypothetical protein